MNKICAAMVCKTKYWRPKTDSKLFQTSLLNYTFKLHFNFISETHLWFWKRTSMQILIFFPAANKELPAVQHWNILLASPYCKSIENISINNISKIFVELLSADFNLQFISIMSTRYLQNLSLHALHDSCEISRSLQVKANSSV